MKKILLVAFLCSICALAFAQPSLVLSDTELSVTGHSGDTLTVELTIGNLGDATLDWEAFFYGDTVTFSKANNADWTLPENQDRITDSVWITRMSNRGLFNIRQEDRYEDFVSPLGTEWLLGPTRRALEPYDCWQCISESMPPSLVGQVVSMHLIFDDLYFDVTTTAWAQGGGGGRVEYTRIEVPQYLSSFPASASNGPQEEVTTEISVFTEGFDLGERMEYVIVGSNDPNNEIVMVPLLITIEEAQAPPVVVNPIPDQTESQGFGQKEINLAAVFDGVELTYEATSENEGVVTVSLVDSILTVTEVGIGTSKIEVTATDSEQQMVTDDFDFTVLENQPPVLENPIADQVLDFGFGTLDISLEGVFSDPEGGPLTYATSSDNEQVVISSVTSTVLTLSQGSMGGEATVTYSATDNVGAETSSTFLVQVDVVTGLEEARIAGYQIYPNPAVKVLHIEWSNGKTPDQLQLIDLGGRNVLQHQFNRDVNGISLDLSNLKRGLYVLKMTTGGEQVQHRVLLK